MTIEQILAAVAVADIEAAIPWYERLFGRLADRRPMPALAEWADGAGTLQLVHDAARGGQSLVTIGVDDLPAFLAGLAARGVDTGTIEQGTTVWFATIHDPEGNAITLVADR